MVELKKTNLMDKIEKLAIQLNDYRLDEGLNPSTERIEKWINQFSFQNREIIINEMIHIFQKFYFKEYTIDNYLSSLIENIDSANRQPYDFWLNTSLLNIQKDGESQKHLVEKLTKLIYNKYQINISINDFNKSNFVYVDDFLFSGLKLRTDLTTFMDYAPNNSKLFICYLGVYLSGEFYVLNKWFKDNNLKQVEIILHKMIEIENRNSCQNSSDILYPTIDTIKNHYEIENYLNIQGKIIARDEQQISSSYCKSNNLFSNKENRKILEEEFTLAGLKIINSFKDENKKRYWKPLGLSTLKGLGFGGMTLTYYNCPNNMPLAIWWGDIYDHNSQWIPLLPRKTYVRN